MKRFIPALFLLGGCMNAQPSPALLQVQSACQAGDVRACETVLAEERAQRAAVAELFTSDPNIAYVPPIGQNSQRMTTTNCYVLGNNLNCTSF